MQAAFCWPAIIKPDPFFIRELELEAVGKWSGNKTLLGRTSAHHLVGVRGAISKKQSILFHEQPM